MLEEGRQTEAGQVGGQKGGDLLDVPGSHREDVETASLRLAGGA
jgi:hypothetical protein